MEHSRAYYARPIVWQWKEMHGNLGICVVSIIAIVFQIPWYRLKMMTIILRIRMLVNSSMLPLIVLYIDI